MKELKMENRPEFIEDFLDRVAGKTSREIAIMVWDFGNKLWQDGYNQGRYDPDFEKEVE